MAKRSLEIGRIVPSVDLPDRGWKKPPIEEVDAPVQAFAALKRLFKRNTNWMEYAYTFDLTGSAPHFAVAAYNSMPTYRSYKPWGSITWGALDYIDLTQVLDNHMLKLQDDSKNTDYDPDATQSSRRVNYGPITLSPYLSLEEALELNPDQVETLVSRFAVEDIVVSAVDRYQYNPNTRNLYVPQTGEHPHMVIVEANLVDIPFAFNASSLDVFNQLDQAYKEQAAIEARITSYKNSITPELTALKAAVDKLKKSQF